MSIGSLSQRVARRKPARRALVYIAIPPLAFRDFSLWPAVGAIYEGPEGSVVGVRLDHPDAAAMLSALGHLGGRRVRPFAHCVEACT